MSNIIEDLYYGNLEPQETQSGLAHELKNKLKKLNSIEDQLRVMMPSESKRILDEYIDAYNDFSSCSCADAFISGFKHGARFIHDTFIV